MVLLGCIWCGGRLSYLAIFVQLGWLGASGGLSGLPAFLLSSRTFLDSLCIFRIGVSESAFSLLIGLGCRLHLIRWQLVLGRYLCLTWVVGCIRCPSSCSCSSCFPLNFLNSFCIFHIGVSESAFWVGLG